MPDQDGFALLRSLASYDFEIIFVTAYDQYAIQAMRFAAVDYLLKPVDINELQGAVGNYDCQTFKSKRSPVVVWVYAHSSNDTGKPGKPRFEALALRTGYISGNCQQDGRLKISR